ncbi:hypothetical protein BV394_07535 [Brevirhabdus pacifica]|uniref:Uncharacterized protein n=1 Tax=Brevirhabdus pacifica TaxID=1267768 RepID=A0A1U7DI68_9RHOB|nr:OmpA family protein [Brevirhabdus pacifica]APX89583.1 hypothetical protein BV394_07535 [Brevirhabdus pacifica]PJJ85749.1 OOP family OmpA-OmpF porin [Brevirhabdus pacifica]
MRLGQKIIIALIFVVAAGLSVVTSRVAVQWIEERTLAAVDRVIAFRGIDWVDATADGLRIRLIGTAPDEARRFEALSIVGSVVDSERVIDAMEVVDTSNMPPPKFSIEILRNDRGISLIGLIPAESESRIIVDRIEELTRNARVADMLDEGEYPVPEGWPEALDFAIEALGLLPRSKISVAADMVAITAITGSAEEKQRLEEELALLAPEGLLVTTDLTAPRPVITPFTLRFVKEAEGPRFDACSADTPEARDRILEAAARAGVTGEIDCTIGLGVPSPNWAAAVETAIAKLDQLEGGNITFSDADVTLVALETVEQADFDRVVGELKADLPEVFSVKAILPDPPAEEGGDKAPVIPEFTARRDEEGALQMRGRLRDEMMQDAVTAFAQAKFGADRVYNATRLDDTLPDGWPVRVLAGLAAMSELETGALVVRPDLIRIEGETGSADARQQMARILSERLGKQDKNYELDVRYIEALDPSAALPTPRECADSIQAEIAKRKITFAPGSLEIDPESLPTVDAIARILDECTDVRFEIGGHTDSQGREEMNLNLSQARADSVLNALMARQVLTGNLTAKGYGESDPIADNDTEDGREANRRIEFRLLAAATDRAKAKAKAEGEAADKQAAATAPDGAGEEGGPGADEPTEGAAPADSDAEDPSSATGATGTTNGEAR